MAETLVIALLAIPGVLIGAILVIITMFALARLLGFRN
jgi:hypothetical protein